MRGVATPCARQRASRFARARAGGSSMRTDRGEAGAYHMLVEFEHTRLAKVVDDDDREDHAEPAPEPLRCRRREAARPTRASKAESTQQCPLPDRATFGLEHGVHAQSSLALLGLGLARRACRQCAGAGSHAPREATPAVRCTFTRFSYLHLSLTQMLHEVAANVHHSGLKSRLLAGGASIDG